MATYNEKDNYALNFDADKKILRAEFVNAMAPALNKAMAELALQHTSIETREEAPRRLCSAFEDVQELAETGVRRWLEAKTGNEVD